MNIPHDHIVVLGGGLAGLAAGRVLSDAGRAVTVCEREPVVGGLSRTIERNGFRFDLGGHRFHTTDPLVEGFVRELMGDELVTVSRSSKIHMRGKYFDYPLRPFNAMFGLGVSVTSRIIADYISETVKAAVRKPVVTSLEDWVVGNFGRTMFDIYFKEYSEKVWGIGCDRISATWVAQRIRGLSLAKAIKHAVFRFSGKDLATLTDRFLYPRRGIGRLAERLQEEIEHSGAVLTDAEVLQVNHAGGRVLDVLIRHQGAVRLLPAEAFISSIPLTKLVSLFHPEPPFFVKEAAAQLRFRDLVIVAVMVKREQVTDQTWIYVPEKHIPFGRIHEPTNWSREMAPPDSSLLVTEYFSFRGDAIWCMDDQALASLTIEQLVKLRFLGHEDVVDTMVVRVPQAYPLFEIGYREHASVLLDYFEGFVNLELAGRSGMFLYHNMDAALRSGMDTALRIMQQEERAGSIDNTELSLADTRS
jgi:protoporphyrinogen oxidase